MTDIEESKPVSNVVIKDEKRIVSAHTYVLLAGYCIIFLGTLATLAVKLLGLGTAALTIADIVVYGLISLAIMVLAHIIARKGGTASYLPFLISALTVFSFASFQAGVTSAPELFCLFFINILMATLYFDYRVIISTTLLVFIIQSFLLWYFPELRPENIATVLATRYLIYIWAAIAAVYVASAGKKFLTTAHHEEAIANQRYNQMRQSAQSIQTTSHTIYDYMQEINRAMDTLKQSFEQINSGIQEIAASAQSQANDSEKTYITVHDAKENLIQTNQHLNELNELVAGLTQAVNNGSHSMEEQLLNMQETVQANQEVVAAVESFSQHINYIGNILETINSIAEQTNLLALNAAIEAARAGENGRGFAVVAEEIRKLAAQSADATSDISAIIEQIKVSTADMIAKIEVSNKQFSHQQELAAHANKQFVEIGSSNEAVAGTIAEFINFIAQMNTTINQVIEMIQQNSATAEQLAASTQEIQAATDDQKQELDKVAATVNKVMQITADLNDQGHQLLAE